MRQRIMWRRLGQTLLGSEPADSDSGQNEPRVCCEVNARNFYPVVLLTSTEKSQQMRIGYGLLRCFANSKLP